MTEERSATPEAAKTSIDRFMYFSDAVLAIALTLLAIDLPIPQGNSRATFFSFIGDNLGTYLAFLISFVVIAQQWRAHYGLFRYVVDATPRLVAVNALWLMTVVLTPFATKVLWAGDGSAGGDFPFRFSLYAVVQAVAALTFMRSGAIIAREGLLMDAAPTSLLARSRARSLALAGTFIVSIGVVFLVGSWAFVMWFALPVAMRLMLRRVRTS